MALVPVFCDNCGTVFATTSFIGGSGSNITMIGNKVGPCPACGGMGSVPDGVYNLVDDTVQVVTSLGAMTSEHLQRLFNILSEAASAQSAPDEVVAKVQAEDPDLAPVINILIQQGAGQNWQQWLMIFLVLVGLLLSYLQLQQGDEPEPPAPTPAPQQPISQDDINRITESVADELRARPRKPGEPPQQPQGR